jgi:hypothetical protein
LNCPWFAWKVTGNVVAFIAITGIVSILHDVVGRLTIPPNNMTTPILRVKTDKAATSQ